MGSSPHTCISALHGAQHGSGTRDDGVVAGTSPGLELALVALEELEVAAQEERLESVIHPFSDVLADMPRVTVGGNEAAQLGCGRALILEIEGQPDTVCARTEAGKLIAILVPDGGGRWKPRKVFPTAD